MTGAGNHVIPNVHFRKVNGMFSGRNNRTMLRRGTWFDQAGRKKRRALNRKARAAKLAPRPAAGRLRPTVRPPSARYNMKLRLGRGFTLAELKEAKIPKKLAPTIGIAVDHRRKNRCVESLQRNVARLLEYKSKLMIFPKRSGKKGVKKGDTPRDQLPSAAQNTLKEIIPIVQEKKKISARAITAEEKEFNAFKTLRKARSDKKYWGKRQVSD